MRKRMMTEEERYEKLNDKLDRILEKIDSKRGMDKWTSTTQH